MAYLDANGNEIDEGPSLGEKVGTNLALPAIGAVIGGKTPLGPVGSGIGAATGQAYGDLYNMFAHGDAADLLRHPLDALGGAISHPSAFAEGAAGEAKKLGTVGGLTTATELGAPPVLKALGSMIPGGAVGKGAGLLGSGILGSLFGHPGVGAAVGAGLEAAPKVADAISWVGTPAGTAAGESARQGILDSMGDYANNPRVQQKAVAAGDQARRAAAGAWADTSNPTFAAAGDYLKGKAGEALDGLKSAWKSLDDTVTNYLHPPLEPTSPTEDVSAIRENLTRTKTSNPSVRPNMSRNPNVRYSADVTVDPSIKPTAGAPTGPVAPAEDSFGPNTVGAAQRKGTLRTVTDAEGLTPKQQGAWDKFKRQNPGTSDRADLNDWLHSQPEVDDYPNTDRAVAKAKKGLLLALDKGKR